MGRAVKGGRSGGDEWIRLEMVEPPSLTLARESAEAGRRCHVIQGTTGRSGQLVGGNPHP